MKNQYYYFIVFKLHNKKFYSASPMMFKISRNPIKGLNPEDAKLMRIDRITGKIEEQQWPIEIKKELSDYQEERRREKAFKQMQNATRDVRFTR